MDLNEYRKMIDEFASAKNLEKDPKKKKKQNDFETSLRKDLRSQEIQRKLENLYNNKEFVGYICVASQFVEFKIKEIILQLQILAILLNKDFKPNENWERRALGPLIIILENNCIKDSALIKQLNDFKNLRNQAIHRLFDTTFEIKDVENEIEIKLTPSFFYYDVTASLDKYLYGITVKAFETKDKMGQVSKETKITFEKLRKKMEEMNPNLKK